MSCVYTHAHKAAMLMEEQRTHLQKFSKNRKKKSGKTDEQRFANVRDVAVPILAV